MRAFRISVKMAAFAAVLLASLTVAGIPGAWAHGGGNMMGPGYQGRGYGGWGGMMGPGMMGGYGGMMGPGMMGPGYQGRRYGGWGGMMGPAWQGRGYAGQGPVSQLSKEDLEKINRLRADFWQKRATLRRKMYQKRLELSIELSKEKPNLDQALKIQDALSGLRAQLARMRLEHVLALRKINPQFGAGWGMPGPGYHGRACGAWGGMMGPGMMGGYGGMMGPGMMGPGYQGRGYYGRGAMMGPWNGPPAGTPGKPQPPVKQ